MVRDVIHPLILTVICLALASASLHAQTAGAWERINPQFSDIDMRETLRPSAIKDVQDGAITISGRVRDSALPHVTLRVTTGSGQTCITHAIVQCGTFRAVYPRDFPDAPPLAPCVLFIDAIPGFANMGRGNAEATLIVYDSRRRLVPDYPSAFTTGLLDKQGRRDNACSSWYSTRALVNLYIRSYGARLAGVGKSNFDLDNPADLAYYKNSLALYDFDGRDRDWSQPWNQRIARTFWKSVYSTWFNASNDNPVDGNPANGAASNYVPYAFTNDFSDILIMHLMRLHLARQTEDNEASICNEALENLLACQHTGSDNFALPVPGRKREVYTAGAFRYGMFVDGQFLTERKGWFYNPAFRDYASGGVLNGRAVWALGEALRADPKGADAGQIESALALALQFCLNDALQAGYAKRTAQGHIYWRDAGEHAYLLLGMLSACEIKPGMIVLRADGKPGVTLRDACIDALDAIVDLEKPHGRWSVYPNVDSMAVAALAQGAIDLHDAPEAKRWRQAAQTCADGWLAATVDASEFRGPIVHFGLRLTSDAMTYRWHKLSEKSWANHNYIFFYQTGHWIHALSQLYALTGDARYKQRADAMVSYLCGDNPWGVRLLNELGGVYNWVEDRDGDGIEDNLKQDMYPESTTFCLIGVFHLMQAEVGRFHS